MAFSTPEWQEFFETRWNNGELMKPAAALAALRDNPLEFLKRYPVLNTFDCRASGPTQAFFANFLGDAFRPGSVLKTAHMHLTQAFRVNMAQFQNGEGDAFDVIGIFTGQSNVDPVWYALPATGPDIMLTAKLTGCTFVARPTTRPGEVEVTHLQPNQETGLHLNERMRVEGREAYGRLDYNYESRSINVIGVRSRRGWEIYTQKLEKERLAIRSVHRLFPH